MPVRRTRRARPRRTRRMVRRYRRRRPRPAAMRILSRRMPALFPDVAKVKFHYSTLESFSLEQNIIGNRVYRLNSLYDPEFALGGGQPMGFDQWSTFYLKYLVYASRIKLEFIMESVNPIEVFLGPDNDESPPSTSDQWVSLPYYKHKVVNSAWAPASRIAHVCSVSTLEGRRIGSEDDYAASTTANPFKTKFWQMGLLNSTSAQDITVNVRVTITYYAKMFQRRTTLVPS